MQERVKLHLKAKQEEAKSMDLKIILQSHQLVYMNINLDVMKLHHKIILNLLKNIQKPQTTIKI